MRPFAAHRFAPGNPAIQSRSARGPEALRPRLPTGMPLTVAEHPLPVRGPGAVHCMSSNSIRCIHAMGAVNTRRHEVGQCAQTATCLACKRRVSCAEARAVSFSVCGARHALFAGFWRASAGTSRFLERGACVVCRGKLLRTCRRRAERDVRHVRSAISPAFFTDRCFSA